MAFAQSYLKDKGLFVEKAYINGQWVSANSGSSFKVTNPATDDVFGSIPESGLEDLNDAIEAASKALDGWKRQSGRQRGRILRKLADLLLENREDLSKIITAENGKAKADALGEVM
jgi:succinate-semialdehyde dehydrogenase / glutarate-semialdehyde dehydrogenase